MISKNQLKRIRALGLKKQRKAMQEFLVQGEKNVVELLHSDLTVLHVFATTEFINQHAPLLDGISTTEASETELSKASTLTSNNAAIAIVKIPMSAPPITSGVLIALDGVSDPGNLGTIIRLADWYGIRQIVMSNDCADPYNPKTISATMGSFARVNVCQLELSDFLSNADVPIYGAYLSGENVHHVHFADDAILLMGSESHGIREQAEKYVTSKITIPNFGHAESLNVAMATGIILDNIKRNG